MDLDRGPLLADHSRTGAAWCKAYSDLIDEWLSVVLATVVDGDAEGVALVAVGGYGRAELCPGSDIDVMLVHGGRPDIDEIANRVWYPDLGHRICSSATACRRSNRRSSLANDDLDTATALLSRAPRRRRLAAGRRTWRCRPLAVGQTLETVAAATGRSRRGPP